MNQSHQDWRGLIDHWSGSMGGAPPLNAVNVDTLRAALEEALERSNKELVNLQELKTTGDFNDTLLALDQLGEKQ